MHAPDQEGLTRGLIDYCVAASRVAVHGQPSRDASLKQDKSMVTDIDLRLSEMAFEYFQPVVGEANIISEEHLQNMDRIMGTGPSDSGNGDDELLVVVDPIDGTRNYAHGMPLYGISIGVLRNRRPWLGAVAFPAFDELLVTDGQKPYIGGCNRNEYETMRKLSAPSPSLESSDVVLMGDATRLEILDFDVCDCMSIDCATLELCWPLLGRGSAAIVGAHVWDFCGAWPIAEQLGFEMRGLRSGKRLEAFDPQDYSSDDYTIHERFVLSLPEHFERIATSALGRHAH